MLSVVFTATTRSVAARDSRHVGSLLRVFLLLVHGFLHSGALEELLDSEARVADSEELLVRLLVRGCSYLAISASKGSQPQSTHFQFL